MLMKHPILRATLAFTRQHRCHYLPTSVLSISNRKYASVSASKPSASGTSFQLTEINGIKLAAREDGDATTGLSVVIRAGARYSPIPGLAHLLDKFAWNVKCHFANWLLTARIRRKELPFELPEKLNYWEVF